MKNQNTNQRDSISVLLVLNAVLIIAVSIWAIAHKVTEEGTLPLSMIILFAAGVIACFSNVARYVRAARKHQINVVELQ